ncbi:translation initiation factor IF-2-like protein [Anaerobacterium chartisolvens]|uniref:Translation initiation factor IF-2-like protein n=1 Tax=Anaerobacterium chartisolvens TaxID=1297424 RepID=A0A369AQV6_9FIRM|nr:translation initiation factor IF-2-like protein [Anaerobacterium chartisolvens]
MEKARVYELAKELNTTSKRLMEKLSEINITVKNHMSLLEENELKALYKHIGVIKHDDGKKEAEDRKIPPANSSKSDVKKETKHAPRIIRTTEIIIDTKGDSGEEVKVSNKPEHMANNAKRDGHGESKGGARKGHKPEMVRIADSNSGLRPGYIRDPKPEYLKEPKPFAKAVQKSDAPKEHPKQELYHEPPDSVKDSDKKTHKEELGRGSAVQELKPAEAMKKDDNKPEDKISEAKQTEMKSVQLGLEEKKGEQLSGFHAEGNADTAKPDETNEKAPHNAEGEEKPHPKSQGAPEHRAHRDGNQAGGYNRPQGDRPQGGYNRPQGDRPQGGYNRPQGDRPQGG